MDELLTTTKELAGKRVVSGKSGKRIGKVRHFVFHPSERRVLGFTVKRPDAALMFHRKDLFVPLGGFDLEDGQVILRAEARPADKSAGKALGVDWDACVIWVGMPIMTVSGDFFGYVDVVTFECATGRIRSLATENGVANNAVLGKYVIPGNLVKGFKRGQGAALAPMGDYHGEDPDERSETGAILVADEAIELTAEGGMAEAAGKATAVVADKARKGASKAKKAADERLERARPAAKEAARRAGEVIDAGAYATGRQIGRASGMFAAFKEEFDKAAHGESEDS